jgi:hypothetical protein
MTPTLHDAVKNLRAALDAEERANLELDRAFKTLMAHPAAHRRPGIHTDDVLTAYYQLEEATAEALRHHFEAWRRVRDLKANVVEAALIEL